MKYTVLLTNIPDAGAHDFDTLDEARAWMEKRSYESAVYAGETLVGTWSPLYGYRGETTQADVDHRLELRKPAVTAQGRKTTPGRGADVTVSVVPDPELRPDRNQENALVLTLKEFVEYAVDCYRDGLGEGTESPEQFLEYAMETWLEMNRMDREEDV